MKLLSESEPANTGDEVIAEWLARTVLLKQQMLNWMDAVIDYEKSITIVADLPKGDRENGASQESTSEESTSEESTSKESSEKESPDQKIH